MVIFEPLYFTTKFEKNGRQSHCEKVYDSHVDDCPDGDFYFYPKQCDDGK